MPREHRTHSLSQRAHRVTAHARARREQMRARGPLNWDTVAAKRGPRALAIKNHFIAMLGEYVGTVLFMIFALGGTNVALIPNNSITGDTATGQDGEAVATVDTSNLLYISLSFGFSLAVNAWIFFRISGGLFNPAVSLGMVLVRALTPLRGALLSISQILGGITGAAIIQAITPGTLNVTTSLAGGTSIAQGLFIEMFLTSLLMLAILLLAAEKHKATFIAPIGIGLALFVAELLGVYYTGGSLNPARSFGPAVVLKTFDGYHWIYWLGPALGSIIAAGFYKLLKFMQYETVLGPEADEDAPHTGNASGTPDDAEKGQSGGYSGPTADISGPGLGDLHTIDGGNSADVYDLEQRTGGFESRLINIEYMLEHIIERDAQVHGNGRPSDLTYVESSPRQGSKHIDDNHHHEKQPLTHQVNGGPRGPMASQSVAGTGAAPIAAVYHNGEPVAVADNGGIHPSSTRGGASNVSGQPKSTVSRSSKQK